MPGAKALTPRTVAVAPGFTITENRATPFASWSSEVTECRVLSKLMTLSVPPWASSTVGVEKPPRLAPESMRTVAASGASLGADRAGPGGIRARAC